MGFSLSQFSRENVTRLNKEKASEESELKELQRKSGFDLWREDLVKLRKAIAPLFD